MRFLGLLIVAVGWQHAVGFRIGSLPTHTPRARAATCLAAIEAPAIQEQRRAEGVRGVAGVAVDAAWLGEEVRLWLDNEWIVQPVHSDIGCVVTRLYADACAEHERESSGKAIEVCYVLRGGWKERKSVFRHLCSSNLGRGCGDRSCPWSMLLGAGSKQLGEATLTDPRLTSTLGTWRTTRRICSCTSLI